MQTWPAEQVTAHADHSILGRVQTNVALVEGFLVLFRLLVLVLAAAIGSSSAAVRVGPSFSCRARF